MKQIFTFIVAAIFSIGAFAQDDVVVLSTETYDATNSDDNTYHFTGTDITINMYNRAFKIVERQGWNLGINLKNNQKYEIVLPAGIQLYGIAMSGFSQGSNWEYLYGYGVGDAADGYEWTDPIGKSEKNNITISTQALYPIDPCEVVYDDESQGHTEHNNVAGYTFAKISFGNEPYEGEFPVHFCGNNQLDVMFTLYLSKEAADAALSTDGIAALKAEAPQNHATYNLAGQQVDSNYKGIVIRNGNKFIQK